VAALKNSKKSLEALLGNEARFKDVVMLGQDRFKGVDVAEEFSKVANFQAFAEYNVKDVEQGIKDMLELFQYRDLITVCVYTRLLTVYIY